MSFERISQKGFIDEFTQVTKGAHPSKFCFVLGAGASKSSGIKTGQELVDFWEGELIERNYQDYMNWKDELNITEENKYSFYSQYYKKRYQKRPIDGLNFLEKMMEDVNPNVGYVVLSYLLTSTRHNVVVTTNFDHLAEDAVNYYAHTLPLTIGHENLAHYISQHISRPTIIKIHRDLLFDPKNAVEEVEVLHEAWKEALNRIFSEYHPVFIGYEGNDNSLMNYLIENIEQFKVKTWKFPYWTLYKSDCPNSKVEEFLNGAEGYCINCNGFDELMCLLGAELDYEMPTEEVFLEDTRKRYHGLVDMFENIVSNNAVTHKDMKQQSEPNVDSQMETLEQAMQKITSHTDASTKYVNATRLHNQGKYSEALQLKKELVHDYPENIRYHSSLYVTLYAQEQYEEAEKEVRKIIEMDSQNAYYYNQLSIVLSIQGKYEEAEEEVRKAVALDPKVAVYHNSLSMVLSELRKYEEAEEEARMAVALEPGEAMYHDSLSSVLEEQEKYEEAEEEARKAVALEPKEAMYHDSLSSVLDEQGKYEEAEEEARKAVALEPGEAMYHNILSSVLVEQGKYEEAEEEARKAVTLEPEEATYHYSLSTLLGERGKYEEAEEEARAAVVLNPEEAAYHYCLSEFLDEQGNYKDAKEEAKIATELIEKELLEA